MIFLVCFYSLVVLFLSRIRITHGHKIHNPKSEPNPNRKIQSALGPKCKKYLNGSCKVVQNICELEVLLTEPERLIRKTEKTKKSEKISEETGLNVQTNIQCNYMKHEYILHVGYRQILYRFRFNCLV